MRASHAPVDEIRPSLAYRRDDLAVRTRPPVAVVIHTTGSGVVDRCVSDAEKWRRWRARYPDAAQSPYHAALWVYTQAYPYSGHYLIGQRGETALVVPETHVAQHVGAADSPRYRRPGWCTADYAWWARRWPGLASPRDLADGELWQYGSCNAQSIGIEVAPPIDDPQGPWSDECWQAIARVTWSITTRHAIPATRDRILTHSDAHPLARTARGEPTDPGPRQWRWSRFTETSGAPW